VRWYASVYGFPLKGQIEDCTGKSCPGGARRYLIKGMMWRSLAFTRKPVNQALRGQAKIVSAKAMMVEIRKAMSIAEAEPTSPGTAMPPQVSPRVDDLWAGRKCVSCAVHEAPTLAGYRAHFQKCAGMTEDVADLCAYAMMHRTNMENVMASLIGPP
jgi:hypothetical protein